MKITILYNRVEKLAFGKPEDILADNDTVKTAQAVAEALRDCGYKTNLFKVDTASLKKLADYQTDFFFNLAEGVENLPNTEYKVIAVLQKTKIPFSGNSAQTIRLTTNKVATKELLIKHHLPTPQFQVMSTKTKRLDGNLRFPVIIKLANKDGSLGINGSSVLTTTAGILGQATVLRKAYKDNVLVEEYIDGRELNAAILGTGKSTRVLPISEITFGPSFADRYKIVSFAAKWEEKSTEYRETQGKCPARLADNVRSQIEKLALEAYKITGCCNYARVDFRLDANNRPWILEVNANPGLAPDTGFVRSARAAGLNYAGLLREIITDAVKYRSERNN